MRQDSKLRRVWQWGDVRRRKAGMWAYALNRITGLGLVLYLYIHLAVLSLLAGGPAAWDPFIQVMRSPFFYTLDVILIAGWLIHGLNGLRVIITGVGLGLGAQKALFVGLMVVAAIALIIMGVMVFRS